MDWVAEGLASLFFWVLIGQYVYRGANRENRSSPILRGIFWGVFGVVGAVTYLAHIQDREKNRLGWRGFSTLLLALWVVGTFGLWALNGGFYLWAGLFTGVYSLYWQFNPETERTNQSSAQNRL